jgi:hypothetical protein
MRAALAVSLCVVMQAAAAHAACDASQPSQKPASQYILKGDIAQDKQTRLTWRRCSVGQSWKDGEGCLGAVKPLTVLSAKQLEVDGWRLPTRDELATLVSPTCSKPAINEDVFPDMDAAHLHYWSSTANGDSYAAYVNFATGMSSFDANDEPYAVRLVRDGK